MLMARLKGSRNRYPTADQRITVRVPMKLLNELDQLAGTHGQNRSEAVLEALRSYVRKG